MSGELEQAFKDVLLGAQSKYAEVDLDLGGRVVYGMVEQLDDYTVRVRPRTSAGFQPAPPTTVALSSIIAVTVRG